MNYDLWIDYQARRTDGLTPALAKHGRARLELTAGEYLVVGAEDAEPAVAEVVDVRPDGVVLLRVLDGPATDHLSLVRHASST